jgi:hypothetical protein
VNHAIAIAARDLRGRSRFFILAGAFAFVPFLAAMLPAARMNRGDVIAMTGAVLSVALALGSAVVLGANVIGRDLSERRLSFYFSKPISPVALWSGKAVAALLTSLLCLVVVATPALLAGGASWRTGAADMRTIVAFAAVMVVVLFVVSHAVSTMFRSRSPLVALDLLLAVGTLWVLFAIMTRIAFNGALTHASGLVTAAFAAIVIALAVAPVWQLANGRTDRKRNHVALSRVVWPAVAVIVLAAGAYAAWLLTPDLEDLAEVRYVETLPQGEWSVVSGMARNRGEFMATFVVNRRTGESHRVPTAAWWGTATSRDGRTLSWLQPASPLRRNGQFELYVRDLASGEDRNTGVAFTRTDFVLSDDGKRVAGIQGKVLSIHEVATGKILASTVVARPYQFFFANDDQVLVYERVADSLMLNVRQLRVGARSMPAMPSLTFAGRFMTASADGSRILPTPDVVVDSATNAAVFTLPEWPATEKRSRMLYDGGVARTGKVADTVRVQRFTRDGRLVHEVVLPGMRSAIVVGDTTENHLVVVGRAVVNGPRTAFLLDGVSGAIVRKLENEKTLAPGWSTDPRVTAIPMDAIGWNAKGRA